MEAIVTGANGFLGMRIVLKMVHEKMYDRIYLPIRTSRRYPDAKKRFAAIVNKYNFSELLSNKIVVIELNTGDLERTFQSDHYPR